MRLQPGEGALMWYTTPDIVRMLGTSGEVDRVVKPWGEEHGLSATGACFTVKFLRVYSGQRTSLQVHEHKHEVIFLIGPDDPSDHGFIETGNIGEELVTHDMSASTYYIPPGIVHRVTGPLEYIEVSTYNPDDVTRLADDYGR